MTALQTRWVADNLVDPMMPLLRPHISAVTRAERDKVLVVEHQRVVADDIAQAFEAAGARVVGVASCVRTALALIAEGGPLDGAILDLRGETTLSVADELTRRGIPFLFLTSGDMATIPERFTHVTRCEKPLDVNRLVPLLLVQRVQQDWPRASRPERGQPGRGSAPHEPITAWLMPRASSCLPMSTTSAPSLRT